jgi:phosphonate transport system substrate-binding protein
LSARVAEADFEPILSGRHHNSVMGAADKDCPVASVADSAPRRMIARDVIEPTQTDIHGAED